MKTVWLGALTLLSIAGAVPKLGETLPPHSWAAEPLELVVVYSHDCGDLGALWKDVLAAKLPVRVVNAETVPAPAPSGLDAWRGEAATAFSRALKVRVYPTILLVRDGRLLNVWEGTFDLGALKSLL